MNYISSEEFLKQSEKVQKVLLDWWKPEITNLYTDKYERNRMIEFERDITHIKLLKSNKTIPLLQMHQLIQFIENKGYKFVSVNNYIEVDKKQMWTAKAFKTMMQLQPSFETFEEDKLQALWKVAIEIAEESV